VTSGGRGDRWRIDVLRASAPDGFDLATAQAVLAPERLGVDAVKEPYVTRSPA
jgi:hypothetical protein